MSSVSSVQLTGSQNTNSYKTNAEDSKKNLEAGTMVAALGGLEGIKSGLNSVSDKFEKSPLKTGAAIGAGATLGLSGLQLLTKSGRESWNLTMDILKECGLGKGARAASVAGGFAIVAGAGALIGLGIGAIVKAVKKDGSTEQNTANTETKTLDTEV